MICMVAIYSLPIRIAENKTTKKKTNYHLLYCFLRVLPVSIFYFFFLFVPFLYGADFFFFFFFSELWAAFVDLAITYKHCLLGLFPLEFTEFSFMD